MKALPPETERAVLTALARAAVGATESPAGANAERFESRHLTAASVVLAALARGDYGTAREAIDALAAQDET